MAREFIVSTRLEKNEPAGVVCFAKIAASNKFAKHVGLQIEDTNTKCLQTSQNFV